METGRISQQLLTEYYVKCPYCNASRLVGRFQIDGAIVKCDSCHRKYKLGEFDMSRQQMMKNVIKNLGLKEVGHQVYHKDTPEEMTITNFTLQLEASIMDFESDFNGDRILKIFRARFESYLDFIFDENRWAGKYKKKEAQK